MFNRKMCESESIDEVILALAICKGKSRSHDQIFIFFILVDAIKSSLANVLRGSPCVAEVNIGALPTQTQLLYFKTSFQISTPPNFPWSFFIINSAIYQPFNFLCCFILPTHHFIFISLSTFLSYYGV